MLVQQAQRCQDIPDCSHCTYVSESSLRRRDGLRREAEMLTPVDHPHREKFGSAKDVGLLDKRCADACSDERNSGRRLKNREIRRNVFELKDTEVKSCFVRVGFGSWQPRSMSRARTA